MRQLREKLRKEILAWERSGSVQHSTLDELNKLMAEHPMRIRLKTNGKSFATEIWFQPHEPEDLFAPLAHAAATLFAQWIRVPAPKAASAGCIFRTPARNGTHPAAA